MDLQTLLDQQFKVKTTHKINPVLTTGALTSGQDKVLSENPNRLAYLVINMSDTLCRAGFTPDVSATKGILISANGGSAGMIWSEDFQLTAHELFIKGTAGKYIFVLEVITAV